MGPEGRGVYAPTASIADTNRKPRYESFRMKLFHVRADCYTDLVWRSKTILPNSPHVQITISRSLNWPIACHLLNLCHQKKKSSKECMYATTRRPTGLLTPKLHTRSGFPVAMLDFKPGFVRGWQLPRNTFRMRNAYDDIGYTSENHKGCYFGDRRSKRLWGS